MKTNVDNWEFKNACSHYEAKFMNRQKTMAELKNDLKSMIDSGLFVPKAFNRLQLLFRRVEASCLVNEPKPNKFLLRSLGYHDKKE